MPTIWDMVEDFRGQLTRREASATLTIAQSYGEVALHLEARLNRVVERIAQKQQAAAAISPAIPFQEGRIELLLDQTWDQINRWAGGAADEAAGVQRDNLQRVDEDTQRLTRAAFGGAPPTAVDAVMGNWVHLPTHAIETFVGRASDGTPLDDLFRSIAGTVKDDLKQTIVNGLAYGSGPREVARQIRDDFGTGLNRALLISRTEMIGAYREGTRATYQENTDILQGWIWSAQLDERTCAACWAMNGTYQDTDQMLDGHPGCRCALVPATQPWDVLGFVDIPDTSPDVPDGEEVFAKQGESFQRRVLGNKAYELYSSGKATLADFIGRKSDPRWGTMRYTRSVKQILAGTGGFQIGAAAKGTFTPAQLTPAILKAPELPVPIEAKGPMVPKSFGEMNGAELRQYLEVQSDKYVPQIDSLKSANVPISDRMTVIENRQTDLKDLIRSSSDDALKAELSQITAEYWELSDRYGANIDAMDALRQEFADRTSGVVNVPSSADVKLNTSTSTKGKAFRTHVELGLEAFNRILSNQAFTEKEVRFGRDSSSRASFADGTVYTDERHPNRSTVHELGHWMEYVDPTTRAKAQEFLLRRTAGEAEQRLQDLLPSGSFGKYEVAKPDNFYSPYVGKTYKNGATEITSMGIERLITDPLAFLREDPEHFEFAINALRGTW